MPEAVSYLEDCGDRTGFVVSSWVLFLQVWEKRSCSQERSSYIIFSFWLNASGVLGQSQSEWLAEKELLGEESRTVSHESNSSASLNLHFLLKSSFLKEEGNLCCCSPYLWHSSVLLGKGFEDLMTVNLARYKPTGEYVTVRRINLEACSNEMVTFLQVKKNVDVTLGGWALCSSSNYKASLPSIF